jgi:hypothetical protein
MSDRELNVGRLALVAVLGALILETVLTFATGLRTAFTVRQVPAHLSALLVGALAGWLFELFREMTRTTTETLRVAVKMQERFEALTAKITYQDEALNMLLTCPRHNDALSQLIRASIGDNFRNIPLVGAPSYLAFLRRAVVHSDGYEGIQRRSLRWYKDTGSGAYLSDLRRRNMKYKTRLFIIDEAEFDQWTCDLDEDEYLKYYWINTGDVATYWMTSGDFLANFPGWTAPPKDLALYDRQLLISYDEQARMLSFDVLDKDSDIARLFQLIEQLAMQGIPALHRLETRRDLISS